MNKVVLMGRLTKDPEVRYSQGETSMAIARYTLAVDRRVKNNDGSRTADFISCIAFGKNGEFAEKNLKKGTKIAISGRLQTGSYTNNEGRTVYTTDIVVEEHDFCESKGKKEARNSYDDEMAAGYAQNSTGIDGFMNLPSGMDEELPFT